MNDETAQPGEKLDALLDTVRRHAEEEGRAIDERAAQEARAIVARAHQDARAKVHAAIVLERENGARALEKVRARIETTKRQKFQDAEAAFLDLCGPHLEQALAARWADADQRRAWLAAALRRALEHLHPGRWHIEGPAGWAVEELAPFIPSIAEVSGAEPLVTTSPGLGAGLRIAANGAVVDASPAGVLADRGEIAALLLAELFESKGGAP